MFANPIGMDDDQLKNGCSMIIDPFGDVVAECRTLGDDLVSSLLIPEKLTLAGGFRYTQARPPELYLDIVGKEHKPEQKVSWISG
jgi:5-aminopentanamidase